MHKNNKSNHSKPSSNKFTLPSKQFLIDPKLEYLSLEGAYMDHNKEVSTTPEHLYKVLKVLKASKGYSNFDKFTTSTSQLSDLEFLKHKEYFKELGLAFLYGRSGLKKNILKAIFFLILGTKFGQLDCQLELCKIYIFLENWEMASTCYSIVNKNGSFVGIFGMALVKSLKKKYISKKEYMKLLFLSRTGAINDNHLAVFYYSYLYIKMKGKWVGEFPKTAVKWLDSCTKDGDPSCGYLQGTVNL